MSSSSGQIKKRNSQDWILETVPESQAFTRTKEIKEPAILDPSRLSASNIARDNLYTYAKPLNAHKNGIRKKIRTTCAEDKPYRYTKAAQRGQKQYIYAKAIHKRTQNP